MMFYVPIVLMILATTMYHIAQKSVPSDVNPTFSLAMNYITALIGTFLLIPLYPLRTAGSWSLRNVNWASCAVGTSIVGVELAVLLAYRTGLLFFHEHLSRKSIAGVALCLAGLALITQR
jgi:drug/metabolite transporter (DMT)-like permease